VVATDSTSINLFKVLSAALNIARRMRRSASHRQRAQQLPDRPVHRRGAVPGARLHLKLVEPEESQRADRRRRGADAHPRELPHRRMHDMAAVTARPMPPAR
jgi:hypothetical protein